MYESCVTTALISACCNATEKVTVQVKRDESMDKDR